MCRSALQIIPLSSVFSWPRRFLYRVLLLLCQGFDFSASELRSVWSWASEEDYVSHPEFSFNWRLIQNALCLVTAFKGNWSYLPDCHRCDLVIEEIDSYTFHYPQVFPVLGLYWRLTACFDLDHLVPMHARLITCHSCPHVFSRGKNGGMDVPDGIFCDANVILTRI